MKPTKKIPSEYIALFMLLATVFIMFFASCSNGKGETQFENYKATGTPEDSFKTIIGFPLPNKYLVTGEVVYHSKDTIAWLTTDSTHQVKQHKREVWYIATFQLPADSIRDPITKKAIGPSLDSLGKQKYLKQDLYVPDSLAYFPREKNLDKIKKDHNLK